MNTWEKEYFKQLQRAQGDTKRKSTVCLDTRITLICLRHTLACDAIDTTTSGVIRTTTLRWLSALLNALRCLLSFAPGPSILGIRQCSATCMLAPL